MSSVLLQSPTETCTSVQEGSGFIHGEQESKKQKQDEGWEDDAWADWSEEMQWRDPNKRITKPSDLELYERRLTYSFGEDCGLSDYLPSATTNMEQLAAASLFDFFRLVRFHG